MQDNQVQSPYIVFLKKIWPYVYRVINTTLYFIINLIKNFVRDAIQSIRGV
ncbi:MAG TPA: hypothetical protein VLF93_00645 [Candidatus Saccharimonadales bacterium]|nr:hypothetical protein [Candidatus Saccharimonadales bacterium]